MSTFNKTFDPKVTAKGTELPLLNLRGKPYLQVAHRLVWFEEENPNYHITTDYIVLNETEAVVKATINVLNEQGQAVRRVSATKRETKNDFPDFLEKAETSSIGRALAMLGYGTQFAPEMDEGNRIVDSPVELAKTVKSATPAVAVIPEDPATPPSVVAPVQVPVTEKPSLRKKKVVETPSTGDLW